MKLIATDGTQLGESNFGYHNHVFQLGIYYGKEAYMRSIIKYKNHRDKIKTRNLRTIISEGYYFDILFSSGPKYDDIKTENHVYKVDKNKSNLSENKIGFRVGYSSTETIFGTWGGIKYGLELGLYPGIMGYPKAIFNLYGRCYVSYSLHFLKKNGARWEF
jgi:hypothetical protein